MSTRGALLGLLEERPVRVTAPTMTRRECMMRVCLLAVLAPVLGVFVIGELRAAASIQTDAAKNAHPTQVVRRRPSKNKGYAEGGFCLQDPRADKATLGYATAATT